MIEFPETLHSEETVDFLMDNTRYRVTCVNEWELYVEAKDVTESDYYPAPVGTNGYYVGCILMVNRHKQELLQTSDVNIMAYALKEKHSQVYFDVLESEWDFLTKVADVRDHVDTRTTLERLTTYLSNMKIMGHQVNEIAEGAD